MKTILLTGFEPYGNTPTNPAEKVALRLDGHSFENAAITARIVPNTFFKCIGAVKKAIAQIRPESIVMMGEFPGRSMITVERIAQNLNDGARYGLLDNDGNNLQDQLTELDGPAAYYSTLPIRAMVKAMRAEGIPSDISDAAGTFCCNHLMYGVLHHLTTENLPTRAGWIHLPALPSVAARTENLGMPSMSAETAATGVLAALSVISKHQRDISDTLPSRLQI